MCHKIKLELNYCWDKTTPEISWESSIKYVYPAGGGGEVYWMVTAVLNWCHCNSINLNGEVENAKNGYVLYGWPLAYLVGVIPFFIKSVHEYTILHMIRVLEIVYQIWK